MQKLGYWWLLLICSVANAQLTTTGDAVENTTNDINQAGQINYEPVNGAPSQINYQFSEAPNLSNISDEVVDQVDQNFTEFQKLTHESEKVIHVIEPENDPAPLSSNLLSRFTIIRHKVPVKLLDDMRTVLKESWVRPNKVDWVMGSILATYGGVVSFNACLGYHVSPAAVATISLTAVSISMVNTLANQTVNRLISRGMKKPLTAVQKFYNRLTSTAKSSVWDYSQAIVKNFIARCFGVGNSYTQLFTDKFIGISASGLFSAQKNDMMGADKENFAAGNRGYLNRAYVLITSLYLIPVRAYEEIGKLPAISHIGSFQLHFPFHYQLKPSVVASLGLYFVLALANRHAKDKVLGILEKITGFIDPEGTAERKTTLISEGYCEGTMGIMDELAEQGVL